VTKNTSGVFVTALCIFSAFKQLEVSVMKSRSLLSERQYKRIVTMGRAEEVLQSYVKRKPGRPKKEHPLSGAERTRRWRERKELAAQRAGQ
jgi:hypothetical protein